MLEHRSEMRLGTRNNLQIGWRNVKIFSIMTVGPCGLYPGFRPDGTGTSVLIFSLFQLL